ncbi:DUF6415 family natural product biosynthesis protein [Streptomyces sp. NPDC058955]|uniref:DUF6415 family natural product biosynthesis protein n=1 Tax=unclassified Streptomyces TaxID=2593676 RepID=UPI003651D032
MNATAQGAAEQVPDQVHERAIPLDVRAMRERALGALGEAAESLPTDELDSLIQALRGMLMLLIPEVVTAAGRHPKGDMPRICALAGVEEASRRLRTRSVPAASPWALRHTRRLARSVLALTDHYVNLGGGA